MVQKLKEVEFSVLRYGEAASSNKKEADMFQKELSDLKKQIFCPTTGIFYFKKVVKSHFYNRGRKSINL